MSLLSSGAGAHAHGNPKSDVEEELHWKTPPTSPHKAPIDPKGGDENGIDFLFERYEDPFEELRDGEDNEENIENQDSISNEEMGSGVADNQDGSERKESETIEYDDPLLAHASTETPMRETPETTDSDAALPSPVVITPQRGGADILSESVTKKGDKGLFKLLIEKILIHHKKTPFANRFWTKIRKQLEGFTFKGRIEFTRLWDEICEECEFVVHHLEVWRFRPEVSWCSMGLSKASFSPQLRS